MRPPSCPVCAGRRPFCIHKSYPLPKNPNLEKEINEKLKKDFFGPSYSVFVGHNFYPNVFVGPMTGLDTKENLDSPSSWFGMEYSQIIELRSLLIRSKKQQNIFSRSRFIRENQELVLAKKPTDTEIYFRKKPFYRFTLSEAFQPMGPSGVLESMRIAENPKIPQKTEYIVSDELKASEAAFMLYREGQDVYKITSILSSGVLGMDKTKKLVPTRWSVTATDDIVAKSLMKNIRGFRSISRFYVFESDYIDNHFIILLMPGSWEFENFEAWAPGSNWSRFTPEKIIEEYEPYEGRTAYAESQAGGYYASRIACAEYLSQIKKQARAVVFREVSEGYTVPLGVWLVRETARRAYNNPMVFSTMEESLNYLKTRLKIPLAEYIKKSRILGQKRILDFKTPNQASL